MGRLRIWSRLLKLIKKIFTFLKNHFLHHKKSKILLMNQTIDFNHIN